MHTVSPRLLAAGWGIVCSCGEERGVMRPSTSDSKWRLAAIDAASHHGAKAHPGEWRMGPDVIEASMVRQP